MFETSLLALRDRKRLSEISALALRYGLRDILARLHIGPAATPGSPGAADAPERLRALLESLGPTFTKLGQILSTRSDLLGPDWTEALEKLQSSVAPLPWEVVQAELEAALGQPPEAVFASISQAPLAAGSMAQVHRATLRSGEEVVLKLRRPGLRPRIEADMRLLTHIARLAAARWPDLARYQPEDIIRTLARGMTEELDLAQEGRNTETIASHMARLPHIKIARIWPEFSSESLVVQEFIQGIAPNDTAALEAAGLSGPLLASRGTEAFLRMVLVEGMFHADPHPGNLRALPGNGIAFLDFGMTGRLSGRRREELVALLAGITSQDGARVAGLLTDWAPQLPASPARLEAACQDYVSRHGRPPLRLGEAISDFTSLARENALSFPADLALLFKALITADGVMRGLDPDFDALAVATPVVREQMQAAFSPKALLKQGQSLALDLSGALRDLPALLRLLSRQLSRGRPGFEVEVKGLATLSRDIRRAATKLAVAVVTAAFALGLAPTLVQAGPLLLGLRLGTWAGLGLILAGLAWILWPRRES